MNFQRLVFVFAFVAMACSGSPPGVPATIDTTATAQKKSCRVGNVVIEHGKSAECGYSDVGACQHGTWSCNDGVISRCEGAIVPKAEEKNSVDDDCDGAVDNGTGDCKPGETAWCGPPTKGACRQGSKLCKNDRTWSDCVGAVYQVVEACNGLDDDCDGVADNGFNLQSDIANCGKCGNVCMSYGATATCNAGVCGKTCQPGYYDLDGHSGNGCEYLCPNTTPKTETCNGIDDDCDGKADNGFDFESDPLNCGKCGRKCVYQSAEAICEEGDCKLKSCNADSRDLDHAADNGCEYRCPVSPVGDKELCGNNLDDNCDGKVDEECKCEPPQEGVPAQKVLCGNNKGLCKASSGCGADGKVTECKVEVGPVTEKCNLFDDDCDDEIDEGFDLKTDPLNCGKCGRTCSFANATSTCAESACKISSCASGYRDIDTKMENGCEYGPCVPTNSGVEQCDGIDNDCNNKIDDGSACECSPAGAKGIACGLNVGECHAGTHDCGADSRFGACVGAIGPKDETCDEKDNDCDGTPDNGFNKQTDVLNCGKCGIACSFPNSAPSCKAGKCELGACLPNWYNINGVAGDGCEYACVITKGGTEVCDGVDNDCDSFVDEGVTCVSDAGAHD